MNNRSKGVSRIKYLIVASAAATLAASSIAIPIPIYTYSGALGPGQSVAVNALTNVDLTGARTITAWVDIPANPQTLGQPIAVGGATGAGDLFGIAGAGGQNWGVPQYDLYIDHWGYADYTSTAAVMPGQNEFVAMTFDGSSNITFYINGVNVGFYSARQPPSPELDSYYLNTYTIGENTIGGTTTESTHLGDISDISIYDSALMASDIQSLYSNGPPAPADTVAFTASPTNGFGPLTVQFISPDMDSSGQTLTNWNWNFGDGGVSTAQNPSHTYLNTGNYILLLLATNAMGTPVPGIGPEISVMFNAGIVTNGGFETGDFTGWSFPDGQNAVSVTTNANYVYSGSYGAQLGPTSIDYMSQTLSTTPGAAYILSFWLRNNSGANNEFLVSWNGDSLLDLSDLPAGAWSNYTFTVNASSSSTILEFGYENGPSWFGLDDIGVIPVNTAGPMLTIGQLSGNQLQISWPASANLELQTATNLAPPIVWLPVANGIVTNAGVSSIIITNPAAGCSQFYRLGP